MHDPLGFVLIQMSAGSPADFPAINAKQDQLKITPLSAWGKPYTPPATVPVNPDTSTLRQHPLIRCG